MPDMADIASYNTGIPAVVRWVCDRLGLMQLFDQMLPWDDQRCKLRPSTRLVAIIMAILFDRTALYRVEELYEDHDVPLLFGAGVRAEDFNDDALGRALDKLTAAGAAKVFTSACAVALARMGVDWSRLLSVHFDTTSVSVYGAYPNSSPNLRITYGHSKDGHPEQKQFCIGLLATKDGLPVLGAVLDGNASDKTVNAEILRTIGRLVSPEQLANLLYVADSSLVTQSNLRVLNDLGMHFVSRAPSTFGFVDAVKDQAFEQGAFQSVGALSPRRNAAHYWLSETRVDVDGRRYRAIVTYSDSLDARKRKTLDHDVQTERENLEQGLRQLQRHPFACHADAVKAAEQTLASLKPRFWRVEFTVQTETRPLPRSRPGRPPKAEERPVETVFRIASKLSMNQDAYDEAARRAATFVLISNDDVRSARELLSNYKDQQTANEIPFRVIKSLPVAPLFFKRPERVEAFAWLALIAYLVYAAMQYLVRQALAQTHQTLVTPGKRIETTPTARSIFDMLERIRTIHHRTRPSHRTMFCTNPHVRHLLRLLDCPESIFTTVPDSS